MCAKAHELIAEKTAYPLHVGITEAGTLFSGNIKSAVGLGIILHQGIGDTIRVSLTGDPVEEVKSAKLILKTLGLRTGGIEVVPTKIEVLGRCRHNELPFQINRSREADETQRLKYRYLDLRNPEVKNNIILRCNVVAALRAAMLAEG